QEGHTPARRPRRDSPVDRADGGGELDVGVHADPGRAEESRAPGRAVDDRADSAVERHFADTRASDIVADVPAGSLGWNRRRRFLHLRSSSVTTRFTDFGARKGHYGEASKSTPRHRSGARGILYTCQTRRATLFPDRLGDEQL